jgi:Mrp family chromosome partitioning ATPase/predicted Fe-Mo cluster-binding NifX family protein
MAHKDSSCGGCSEHSSACQHSGQNTDERLRQCLSRIKNKIVILSGKGGVGKSSVATNLALGLSMQGHKVGLLDVDVHGPSVPRLLNLSQSKPIASDHALQPIAWSENLSVMSLGFLLPNRDDSVIWRGPLKMSLIRQFLEEVAWGDLDYLLVDCPPGTGDEPLSVLQLIEGQAKAVVVTTPQVLAIDDVRRSINFCRHTRTEVLGIVENMSGFLCPHCGETVPIFQTGGGEALAQETGVSFLGRIPLDPEFVRSGDQGEAYLQLHKETPTASAITSILEAVVQKTAASSGQAAAAPSAAAVQSQEVRPGKNGHLLLAVPVANGSLCQHFGHCEQFALIRVNSESKTVEHIEYLTPPPHEPGVLPKWLSEQAVDLVIAGGMGSRAQSLFQEYGVKVLTGAQSGAPEDIARAFMDDALTLGQNACDH